MTGTGTKFTLRRVRQVTAYLFHPHRPMPALDLMEQIGMHVRQWDAGRITADAAIAGILDDMAKSSIAGEEVREGPFERALEAVEDATRDMQRTAANLAAMRSRLG